jgi:hypothetical protein
MKFLETNFIDYTKKSALKNLHKELNTCFESYTEKYLYDTNLIFYGPPGVGKYTQVLNLIKKLSPTGLKYERKINFNFNKKYDYHFRLSDIHFEIDMELLGCNAKILWNEIYYRILDIVTSRAGNRGIIVCKNFHKIHSELLENFYSYMQTLDHKNSKISYIIITEHIGFLPQNILNRCNIVPIKRPTKQTYMKTLNIKIKYGTDKISNIKSLLTNETQLVDYNKQIVESIFENIRNYESLQFSSLRDNLYNIFIYHLDINECLWDIIKLAVKEYDITKGQLHRILTQLYKFLKFYNNNYRPIYHLEKFVLYLCKELHGL